MAYINKVMLIGNIGKDPEIRMTTTGRKMVSFSLATSRRYRDTNGENRWKERSRTFEGIARAMASQWGKERSRTFEGIARAMASQWGGK